MLTLTLQDLFPGLDVRALQSAGMGNCSITELALDTTNGRFNGQVVSWASCAHLHGEAAQLVPGTPQTGTALPD